MIRTFLSDFLLTIVTLVLGKSLVGIDLSITCVVRRRQRSKKKCYVTTCYSAMHICESLVLALRNDSSRDVSRNACNIRIFLAVVSMVGQGANLFLPGHAYLLTESLGT